jgi:hypothetical protein
LDECRWVSARVTERDLQYEVACNKDNEQDDEHNEHEKNDNEDELWSHAKAGGRLERALLLVATLDVFGPAAIKW